MLDCRSRVFLAIRLGLNCSNYAVPADAGGWMVISKYIYQYTVVTLFF